MAISPAGDRASVVAPLCRVALAAPVSNIVGLAVALASGQCAYPAFTISDVIRTSPGLNIVAAGWTLFAASYALLCFHTDALLGAVAMRRPELHLGRWVVMRRRVSVALIGLMAAIHLVPLPASGRKPSLYWLALHFGTAGSYAAAGVFEAWLMTQRIEPLLRRAAILRPGNGDDGAWLRTLCLWASPGWLVVTVVGALGMWLGVQRLDAVAASLEFAIITLYGTYPHSLRSVIEALERAVAQQDPCPAAGHEPQHAGAAAAVPEASRAARRRRS